MYVRDEILKQLNERLVNQTEIVNKRPNDMVAYRHLSDVKRYTQQMEHAHNLTGEPKMFVYEHIDYRTQGDNHSEISKTPIFECCQQCAESVAWWLRDNNSGMMKQEGVYHSMGEWKKEIKLGEKIVTQRGRSYASSMEDDELRINSEYYD